LNFQKSSIREITISNGHFSILRKYLRAWLSYYYKNFPPQNILKKLKFEHFFVNENAIQQIRIDSVPKNWVVFSASIVTIDTS
jgi:hypothetical protein